MNCRIVKVGSGNSVVDDSGKVHGSSLTQSEAERLMKRLQGGSGNGSMNVPFTYQSEGGE